MRGFTPLMLAAVAVVALLSAAPQDAPAAGSAAFAEAGSSVHQQRRTVIRGTHARLLFQKDTRRVALGDETVLGIQAIGSREYLVLGREPGQSSLTVWFADDSVEQIVFTVLRDLSTLQNALRDVHPGIRAETPPDRDAIVLRGSVPDISFSIAAEAIATAYTSAVRNRRGAEPVLPSAAGAESSGADASVDAGVDAGADTGEDAQPAAADTGLGRPGESAARGGRVINLIKVDRMPATLEERIREAIAGIGGGDVAVQRLRRGDVAATGDTLLLSGKVRSQVDLIRVLTVAGRALGERTGNIETQLRVVADESGAVAGRSAGRESSDLPTLGGSGLRSGDLSNRVQGNIARAKVIELFGGRLVSFIEVEDIPQVRVSVRLYEVNRSRLREWTPQGDVMFGSVQQGALLPTAGGVRAQGDQVSRIGGGEGSDFQNALSLIGGALVNNFQIANEKSAVDVLFSLLAEAGIARSLATPELLVLSGEVATFQSGGQVPVSTSVTTGAADRVFNSVFFVPFGIQLGIRPLVGDGDVITLDVMPQVVEPDFVLTAALRETTSSQQGTTAFSSRALSTSARLQDGQALLVAGLLQRRGQEAFAYTPGLESIPGLGWLAKSFNKDEQDRELVIVVTPSIVRDPLPRVALWEFPRAEDLLSEGILRR